MVYVTHPQTGVRRIPVAWLDGFAPSGFRLATAREIAAWHAAHGLEAPPLEALAGAPCPACQRRARPGAAGRALPA